ncbi:putative DD34D transposase [Trichonephila clavipes]|nr:putative DD34D transposase [Trichonephila clavipes]
MSVDKVDICVSILNKDGVCRQGKAMHQYTKQGRSLNTRYFDVKDAPRTGRSVVENVDEITKIIKVDRHVSSRSIAQELKIDHKIVLNHLRKLGLEMGTYNSMVRKRSWSKCGEAAQTVAKPGLTAMKVLLCIWWNWKGIIY